MTRNAHEHDPEMIDCRNCGAPFDLARQYYYEDLCPSCKKEKDGDDAVDPVVGKCHVCGDEVRSTEQCYSTKAAHPELRRGEGVLVCPDHRDHRWAPDPRGV